MPERLSVTSQLAPWNIRYRTLITRSCRELKARSRQRPPRKSSWALRAKLAGRAPGGPLGIEAPKQEPNAELREPTLGESLASPPAEGRVPFGSTVARLPEEGECCPTWAPVRFEDERLHHGGPPRQPLGTSCTCPFHRRGPQPRPVGQRPPRSAQPWGGEGPRPHSGGIHRSGKRFRGALPPHLLLATPGRLSPWGSPRPQLRAG